MINEILYMETRIFSEFYKRKSISAREANKLFNMYDIWGFIESCYDYLHLGSDELVLEDIQKIMNNQGALV